MERRLQQRAPFIFRTSIMLPQPSQQIGLYLVSRHLDGIHDQLLLRLQRLEIARRNAFRQITDLRLYPINLSLGLS